MKNLLDAMEFHLDSLEQIKDSIEENNHSTKKMEGALAELWEFYSNLYDIVEEDEYMDEDDDDWDNTLGDGLDDDF